MTEFLWNLLGATPILSGLLIVAAANSRRSIRVRQIFTPGVAVLYVIIALLILYRFNDWVRSVLTWSGENIPGVPLATNLWQMYALESVLLLLIFAVIKVLVKPFATMFFAGGRNVGQAVVAQVYEYEREYDLWFIVRRFGNLRGYFRVLYWVSVALAVLYTALVSTYPEWPGFAAAAYPAVAALIIGEFYFALDGLTREEYDRDILGEADRARRVANYGPLRSILREMFPERVLSDGIHLTSSAALESGFRVGELARADDHAERLAGAYFDRIQQSRSDLDVNLVEASVQLLRGKSVLINNPFYVDLTPYLCLPAYYNLLQYRKVLVIAGRDTLADDLVDWMSEGLESITGVPDLWKAELLNPLGQADLDVGVLRFADVHNLELLRNNDEFLQRVGLVLLAEPARMMSTGQLGLGLVLSRCSRGFVPAFAAFDGNHDGLVDALSHLLKVSLTEVVASSLPRGVSSEVLWESAGPSLHAEIMPSLSRYLGLGTEIGAVALKYQVKRVHWVSSEAFPVKDMMWIAGQYFGQINSFADLDVSQDALRDALVPIANPWDLEQEENYFLIVEDEIANVYETVRRYATRATTVGFVNVISSDYLLRDYMVANRDLFMADAKAVPAIVSDFARTERNVVLRLLMALTTFGVTESDLIREFELIGLVVSASVEGEAAALSGESPVVRQLRNLIMEHTEITDVNIRVNRRQTIVHGAVTGTHEPGYAIVTSPDVEAVINQLRPAYFFVEDELEDVNRIGSLLYGHVYQSLLPGQFVTHGGKYYEVQSISDVSMRNGVVLRRAADHIRDRRVYRQLRRYRLEDMRESGTSASRMSFEGMDVIRCLSTVVAESLGYLEMDSRSALDSSRRVLVTGLPERFYVNKAVLMVRFPGIPDGVRKTLTLLLNELFVTVFPHSHAYVSAMTADPEREFADLLPDFELGENLDGRDSLRDAIFIVEDSMIDLGLTVAVERNWDRFMEIISDYLDWNATPAPVDGEAPVAHDLVPDFPERPELPPPVTRWRRLLRRFARRPAVSNRVEDQESVEDISAAPAASDSVADADAPQAPDPADSETESEVPSVHPESEGSAPDGESK